MAANRGGMRSRILTRLGMGASGANNAATVGLVNDFLLDALQQLYELGDWPTLIEYADVNLTSNTNTILYEGTVGENPKFVSRMEGTWSSPIWVNRSGLTAGLSPQWAPVTAGISAPMYNTMDNKSWPQRYELMTDRLEFWPKADQGYPMRLWYKVPMPSFTQDADECPLAEPMVLLIALANAKAHYRQPDAQNYVTQANALIASLKGRAHQKRVYGPPPSPDNWGSEWYPDAKPVVI